MTRPTTDSRRSCTSDLAACAQCILSFRCYQEPAEWGAAGRGWTATLLWLSVCTILLGVVLGLT